LPFHSTAAIFAGGIIKWIMDQMLKARKASAEDKDAKTNVGVLLASGLVAGEALMAVILAFLVLGEVKLPFISDSPWIALLIYPIMLYTLVYVPLKSKGAAPVHLSE
ncbi:MAG: oligopeptide transporter, OPT family, partial [Aliifodinibius sp.]|nr:oligopeptide transporter, OPT family [Fodinibius sp.]NIW79464.1 oligopeptide transporter, OPT family [Calditrichia bacterium]